MNPLTAVITLSISTMIGVIVLRIATPEDTTTLTAIIGLMVPIITAMLALQINQTHKLVNSEMTEFKTLIEKSAHAEGKLEGKDETRY